jgi:hypothetical protein
MTRERAAELRRYRFENRVFRNMLQRLGVWFFPSAH